MITTSTYRALGERGDFESYPAVASLGSLITFTSFSAPELDAAFVSVVLNDDSFTQPAP